MNPNKYNTVRVKRFIPDNQIKDIIKQLGTGTTWVCRSLNDHEDGIKVRVRYRTHINRDAQNKKLIQYLVTNDERRRIIKEVQENDKVDDKPS